MPKEKPAQHCIAAPLDSVQCRQLGQDDFVSCCHDTQLRSGAGTCDFSTPVVNLALFDKASVRNAMTVAERWRVR